MLPRQIIGVKVWLVERTLPEELALARTQDNTAVHGLASWALGLKLPRAWGPSQLFIKLSRDCITFAIRRRYLKRRSRIGSLRKLRRRWLQRCGKANRQNKESL